MKVFGEKKLVPLQDVERGEVFQVYGYDSYYLKIQGGKVVNLSDDRMADESRCNKCSIVAAHIQLN